MIKYVRFITHLFF